MSFRPDTPILAPETPTHGSFAPLTALAAAVALAALPARAADPAPKADGLWRGTAGAAMSATSGNTRSTALQLKMDLARVTTADRLTIGGFANYARSRVNGSDRTTANKLGATGQYDYNLGPRWLAFGRLGLDRDELTELDLRVAAGAGMGWKVIERPDLRFTLFGGLGHSVDRYGSDQTIGGVTGRRFSRTSVLLAEESAHALTSTVSFKQRLEISPGLSGDKATLARFSADLGVALNSTLGLTVGLVNTYDGKPPAGRKRNDLSLFTGLNVKFGAI